MKSYFYNKKKAIRFIFLPIFLTSVLGCVSSNYVQDTFFSATKLEGWKKPLLSGRDIYVFNCEGSKLSLLPTVLDREQVADSFFYRQVNKSKYTTQEKDYSKEYFVLLDYKKNLKICHIDDLSLKVSKKSVFPYKVKNFKVDRNRERCIYYFPLKAYKLTEFTLNFNEKSMSCKVSPITLKIDSRTIRKSYY